MFIGFFPVSYVAPWGVILVVLVTLAGGLMAADPTPAAVPLNRMCPVLTDQEADPSIVVPFEGRRVALCCQRCKRQFLADPHQYAGNLPVLPVPHHSDQSVSTASPASGIADHLDDHHTAASDHAPPSGFAHLLRWLGQFHPALVHFPIALLMAAGMAELIFAFTGLAGARAAARFTLVGTACTAPVTVTVGWLAWWYGSFPGMTGIADLHRWLGTAVALLALAAVGCLEYAHHHPEQRPWRGIARILLFSSVALVGLVGFLGGMLAYGPDHYAW